MHKRRERFLEVSDALELGNPAIVEKDYWVVDLLALLEKVTLDTHQIIFSGGTALAKSEVKILRMSEDVDIKLIPTELFELLTRSAKKRARRSSIDTIQIAIEESQHFETISKIKLDEYRYVELELKYPQQFSQAPCLRPIIKLELMETILLHKSESRSIQSLVSEAYKEPHEVTTFQCVSIASTLVEKVLSMLRRTASTLRCPDERKDDKTLVRHIYDVHFICQTDALNGIDLENIFNTIIKEDIKRYGAQHPQFVASPKNELLFGLIALEEQEEYRARFNSFVEPMVYNDATHDFDTCFTTFKDIATRLLDGYHP